MMKKNIVFLGFISVLTILLMNSCIIKNAATQETGSIKTSTSTPKVVEVFPTAVETTVEATLTTTVSVSSTPKVKQKKPTPTRTWTPQPTLPIDQAQATAKRVYLTNGGCKFPCWMGITPGQTRWDQAKAYLLPFADIYYDHRRTYLLYVNVYFKKPDAQDPFSYVGQMTVKHDIVTHVYAHFSHKDFPLWKFLSENLITGHNFSPIG